MEEDGSEWAPQVLVNAVEPIFDLIINGTVENGVLLQQHLLQVKQLENPL